MIKKRNRIVKKICSFAMIGAIVTSMAIPSLAAPREISKTYSGSFTSDWQKTYEDTMYYTKLTYGYNTSWINEDYAWAQGSFMTKDYNHNAYVRNDNGAHYGNSVDYRFVSKIEVRHKGSTITYKNQFNAK